MADSTVATPPIGDHSAALGTDPTLPGALIDRRTGEVVRWEGVPTDLELPDSDGVPVDNLLQFHITALLVGSLWPVLQKLHPDDKFIVGSDNGIYWRLTEPRLRGCKAPDWYYVPGVSRYVGDRPRRSYVMWQEGVSPHIVLEYVSDDGSEELDPTPWEGKFWVYEHGIRPAFYGIYYPELARLDMFVHQAGKFVRCEPNARGRYEFPAVAGVELGLWQGTFHGFSLAWPRWWDANGVMLLAPEELAEQEKQRADQEKQRAERLAERLRALGQDPDQE